MHIDVFKTTPAPKNRKLSWKRIQIVRTKEKKFYYTIMSSIDNKEITPIAPQQYHCLNKL